MKITKKAKTVIQSSEDVKADEVIEEISIAESSPLSEGSAGALWARTMWRKKQRNAASRELW